MTNGVKYVENAKLLNDLARHQMIKRVLADILVDLHICEIENFDKKEYILLLHSEIDALYQKVA